MYSLATVRTLFLALRSELCSIGTGVTEKVTKTFHSFLGSSSPVIAGVREPMGASWVGPLDWVVITLGEMNGFRLHVHSGCTVYAVHSWWKWMGSVPTSLGEWIHSPWLTWDSWCGKGTAPGCAWCLRGAMLLRGFRLFGVALHREPKGTKRFVKELQVNS